MGAEVRVSEVFASVQGEGPNTGIATTFLRLAGCNLQCPGWGVETTLPNGEVVTGCDSPHSVFPQIYRQPGQSALMEPEELLSKIPESPRNICLTGGEPLLQWKRVEPVVEGLLLRGQTVEVFTNGTIKVPNFVVGGDGRTDFLWKRPTFVMDYKPPSSGEFGKFKEENFSLLRPPDSVKFVIGDRNDYEVCREVVREWTTEDGFVYDGEVSSDRKFPGQWWMGVVFERLDPRELIGWMLEDKLDNVRLNLQVQSLMKMDDTERTAYAKLV